MHSGSACLFVRSSTSERRKRAASTHDDRYSSLTVSTNKLLRVTYRDRETREKADGSESRAAGASGVSANTYRELLFSDSQGASKQCSCFYVNPFPIYGTNFSIRVRPDDVKRQMRTEKAEREYYTFYVYYGILENVRLAYLGSISLQATVYGRQKRVVLRR